MVFNQVARMGALDSYVDLATGYPTFGTPGWLWEVFLGELSRPRRNDADSPYGIVGLREAIADEMLSTQGVRVDPDRNVTITGSASEALTATILAIVPRQSEVVLVSPHFPVYVTAIIAAGATPRFDTIGLDEAFNVDRIEAQVRNASALIINSPHNPTGAVLSQAACRRLIQVCRERHVTVISDEVFGHLVHRGAHVSPLSVADQDVKVVVISDSGKKFDLRGLRLGYVIADHELTTRIRLIQQAMTYRVSVPLQATVAAGLRRANSQYYGEVRAQLLSNANILTRAVKDAFQQRARVNAPAAGCFLLASVTGSTGQDLSRYLAARAGLLTLPSSAFFEGRRLTALSEFVRISLARDPSYIHEAADRLRSADLGPGKSS